MNYQELLLPAIEIDNDGKSTKVEFETDKYDDRPQQYRIRFGDSYSLSLSEKDLDELRRGVHALLIS